MTRNYRRTLSHPLEIPEEITDLQRKAWRWQWVTLAVGLALLLPLTNSIAALLPLLLPPGVGMPIPPRQVSQISVFIPIGLMLIPLGYLSVHYRVTILARSLHFWYPTLGSTATRYGWIVLLLGAALILIAGVTAWPLLQLSPLALPVIAAGVLFAVAMLWLIVRGLKRGFGEQDTWN